MREDGWTLFAFGSPGERETFRLLTSVQGVGGRVALAILSVLTPEELAGAVARGDKAMVGRANGVGPKLASASSTSSPARSAARRWPAPPEPRPARRPRPRRPLAPSPTSASSPPKPAPPSPPRPSELGPDATLDALVRLALRKAAK